MNNNYYPLPKIPVNVDFGKEYSHCLGCGEHPSVHQIRWGWDTKEDSCHFGEIVATIYCDKVKVRYIYFLPYQSILNQYLQILPGRMDD